MDNILEISESKMQKAVDNLEARFVNVRAGRANPSMLNGITAEYYGVETAIQSLANINVPEARQLVIKPFDRGSLKAIEKAINEANLGIAPINNGEAIFLTIPDLTEERRREYVKQVKLMNEEAKVAVRNIRQDTNNDIKKEELSEDEESFYLESVQEITDKYNKLIDEKTKEKENELMQI